MKRKDQFAKVVTYSVGGEIENISPEEADLHIIKSVLKINFVLRSRLGITLKEDSPIEMFLEFIKKLDKFSLKNQKKKKVIRKTVVVNLRTDTHTKYIGRSRQKPHGEFANPYRIGFDGNREQVIALHKMDFNNNLGLQEAVWNELRGETLGCFCKPHACHGDTYVEYIENRERTENETV